MPDTAAIQILRKVKRVKGCKFMYLRDAIPSQYDSIDAADQYYEDLLRDSILRLIKWDLIQAFADERLVKAEEIEQGWLLGGLTFYLSPHAATMEDVLGFSFTGSPKSIFGDPMRTSTWPQVFVLMPFSPELKPIYEDHLKKVIVELGLTVGRADDFFSTGSIVQEVWSAINAASIIVADCTGRNPNVFYEIGISHTIGKDTILMTQSIDDVPFDLRHLRVIKYNYTPRGMTEFEKQLRLTVGGTGPRSS